MYMRLNNIKIKDSYAASKPKPEKFNECKKYWIKNHKQDRYIVVNHNNILVDGYIQYLVLKDAGIDIAEIKISDVKSKKWKRKRNIQNQNISENFTYRNCETIYVFGTLLDSKSVKERVWRIPSSWEKEDTNNIYAGDIVMVHNKNGYSFIKITRIVKLNKCPIDIPVKKVIRKYK